MEKIIIVEKRAVIAEEILKVVKIGNYKVEVVKTNADTKTYLCKCIGRLRHILGEDSGLTITNVYKRGYMLEDLDVF